MVFFFLLTYTGISTFDLTCVGHHFPCPCSEPLFICFFLITLSCVIILIEKKKKERILHNNFPQLPLVNFFSKCDSYGLPNSLAN